MGIIGAACGIRRDDVTGLAKLNELAIDVMVYRPGTVETDLQTIGARHNDIRRVPITANKKKHRVAKTFRQYLAGAVFGVILSGEDALVKTVHQAILDPVWPFFIGRKSYPATIGLLASLKMFDDMAGTRLHLDALSGMPAQTIVRELDGPVPGATMMQTRPLNFSLREFAPVWLIAEVPN